MKEFILSDFEDYLKTYSWLKFSLNNPNTDDEMYSELENMIYRMQNVIYYYVDKHKISKKKTKEIAVKLKNNNFNYLDEYIGEE